MSDELRQARTDLAAALRLAAYFDLHEGICNHFSYAMPGSEDRFLLNPQGLHWSEIRASDLLLVDGQGTVLEGEGEVEVTALCIHLPVHKRCRHARCVLHTHMPYATTLTSLDGGELEPVTQNALRFHGDVAYDRSYRGLAMDEAEGERAAQALGDKRVLFMAHHGVIVVGESMATSFHDLYYLERACMVQVLAMSTGRPVKRVTDNLAAAYADWARNDGEYARAHFKALKRVLDRENPGYAQ